LAGREKAGRPDARFCWAPPDLNTMNIRGILYTMTVTGAAGLAHLVGITPEAPTLEAAFGGQPAPDHAVVVTEKEIRDAYREISSATDEKVDLVIFGCPQCSIQEIEKVAHLVEGKKVHAETELWVCTPIGAKNSRKGWASSTP